MIEYICVQRQTVSTHTLTQNTKHVCEVAAIRTIFLPPTNLFVRPISFANFKSYIFANKRPENRFPVGVCMRLDFLRTGLELLMWSIASLLFVHHTLKRYLFFLLLKILYEHVHISSVCCIGYRLTYDFIVTEYSVDYFARRTLRSRSLRAKRLDSFTLARELNQTLPNQFVH